MTNTYFPRLLLSLHQNLTKADRGAVGMTALRWSEICLLHLGQTTCAALSVQTRRQLQLQRIYYKLVYSYPAQKLRACLFSRWSLFQRSSLVTNTATHHMLVELSCAVDRRMAYFAFYHWNSSWDHIRKRHFETLVNRLVSWWRSWKQRREIRLGAHLKNKRKSTWPFIVQVYKSWRMYQSGIGLGKLFSGSCAEPFLPFRIRKNTWRRFRLDSEVRYLISWIFGGKKRRRLRHTREARTGVLQGATQVEAHKNGLGLAGRVVVAQHAFCQQQKLALHRTTSPSLQLWSINKVHWLYYKLLNYLPLTKFQGVPSNCVKVVACKILIWRDCNFCNFLWTRMERTFCNAESLFFLKTFIIFFESAP